MVIEAFYPGYVKKAISFTIDDGNLPLDKKFIDIVKPYGIKGTFNLVGASRIGSLSHAEYREMYSGFEIANHCKHHPKVILPTDNYVISDDPFDPRTANTELIYKTDIEGIYYKFYGRWWGVVATRDAYIRCIDEGKRELDEIFGAENVRAFVWPYHEQADEEIQRYLKESGYSSVRRTGESTFELPTDKMRWSYNATHINLLARAREYESYPTDKLSFFCFGVHAHDFENDNCWDTLEEFAREYGMRYDEFYYATVAEIFDYVDAVDALVINEGSVSNPSDLTVYIKVNGECVALLPKQTYSI